MNVKELITALLACDMDEEVNILVEKGLTVGVHRVFNSDMQSYQTTGICQVCIDPDTGIKLLDE